MNLHSGIYTAAQPIEKRSMQSSFSDCLREVQEEKPNVPPQEGTLNMPYSSSGPQTLNSLALGSAVNEFHDNLSAFNSVPPIPSTTHQCYTPQEAVLTPQNRSPRAPNTLSFDKVPSPQIRASNRTGGRRYARPGGKAVPLAMIAAANRFKKEALLRADENSSVLSHTVPHPKSVLQPPLAGLPHATPIVAPVQSNSVGVAAAVAAMADGPLFGSEKSNDEAQNGCRAPPQKNTNVEEDAKKALRATRNRQSAAASRERKKAYERDLERRFSLLSEQKMILQRNLLEGIEDTLTDEKRLAKENEELRYKVELKKAEIERLRSRLTKYGKKQKKGDRAGLSRSNSWDSSHWKKKKTDI